MSGVGLVERITQRRGVRQFAKFGIVGLSGALVNLAIFTALQRGTGLPVWADFSIGFMAGAVSNYFLNRRWTFRSTRHAGREGAQFLMVSLVALIVGNIVVDVMEKRLGIHHHHTVWLAATASGVFVNFFINKYWTFRHVGR